MDIRLYTLDFADFRILPASSRYNGYTSMNAEIEFRGSGKFQLVFYDEEIEQFVRDHPEGLLITWGKFEGYLTDYQFKEKEKWLFGSHLNSLLHKFLIRYPQNVKGDLQTSVKTVISEYTPLVFVDNKEGFGDIEFSVDEFTYCDTFIKGITEKAQIGYELYIKDKNVCFELLESCENPMVLSKNNNNIYEAQEDFSNKEAAYSGWYDKHGWSIQGDREIWTPTHISLNGNEGLLRQDVKLHATTEQGAIEELKRYKTEHSITCKTRNVVYREDYKLGDVLRYQTKHATSLKQVSKISLWYEKSTYHEEPELTEWEG